MTKYWLSWRAPAGLPFEMAWPNWIAGQYHGGDDMVAAVQAESVDAAKAIIYEAYIDHPGSLRFLFIQSQPDDWAPWDCPRGLQPRYPRESWMVWP